jgi:hypothetical protein
MHYRIRRMVRILAVTAIVIPWHIHAEDKLKDKDALPKKPSVMVRKLTHSQSLLQGLTQQDYDRLIESSDALIQCREESTWRIDETDQYVFYSNAFLEQLESLKAAAKKKNIDAATLAYLDMTRTCIKCHQTLRRVRGETPRKDN